MTDDKTSRTKCSKQPQKTDDDAGDDYHLATRYNNDNNDNKNLTKSKASAEVTMTMCLLSAAVWL